METLSQIQRHTDAYRLDLPATFHERDLDTAGGGTMYTDHQIWAKRVTQSLMISLGGLGADISGSAMYLIRVRPGARVENQDRMTVDGVSFEVSNIERIGRRWMVVGA